jgi:hypothetical protein
MEPIVERELAAAVREDLRSHGRVVRIDGLADVRDVLAGVRLDPHRVGALEQLGEERDELGPLLLGARGPVARQRAPGHFLEVEEVARDLANLRPLVRRPPGCRRLRLRNRLDVLREMDHSDHGRLHGLSWPHRGGRDGSGNHDPSGECLAHDCPPGGYLSIRHASP